MPPPDSLPANGAGRKASVRPRRRRLAARVALGLLFTSCLGGTPSTDSEGPVVELAEWPRDLPAAFSLTFDDGFGSQYHLGGPILSDLGVKATFFVITKYLDSFQYGVGWEEFRSLSLQGHEICSHTEYHTDFSQADTATAIAELMNSRLAIARHIGADCRFLAWPYGKTNALNSEIASRYYLGARGVGERPETSAPADAYYVLASGVDSTFAPYLDSVAAGKGWLIRVVHRIGDSANEMSVGRMRTQIDSVKSRNFWIAPFGEVFLYQRNREASRIEWTAGSDSTISVSLHHPYADSSGKSPMTIRVRLPDGCEEIVATQAGAVPWQEHRRLEGRPWVLAEMRANGEPLILACRKGSGR